MDPSVLSLRNFFLWRHFAVFDYKLLSSSKCLRALSNALTQRGWVAKVSNTALTQPLCVRYTMCKTVCPLLICVFVNAVLYTPLCCLLGWSFILLLILYALTIYNWRFNCCRLLLVAPAQVLLGLFIYCNFCLIVLFGLHWRRQLNN